MSEIKVIDKAFAIIGCFNEDNKSISLKSIATTTQLNKSTIIRICRSLIKHNFLVKDEFTGNYQLGYSSWKIGSVFKNTFQVDVEMRNILNNICIKTGQSVGYWIRTGQKKVCLYRVNSKSELNHHLTEGSVYPLVAGSGKILLAYSENKTKLIKEIEKRGYIHTAEERLKNIASVAIPIFNSNNKFCGVLNVSGWKQYFNKKQIINYVKILNHNQNILRKIIN
jgi:DNA-binding IclR family transcriptional regulator